MAQTTLRSAGEKYGVPPGQPPREIGAYRILSQLGSGNSGVVYLAEDSSGRRHVALMVLRSDGGFNPRRKERFLKTARAITALDHDHIVRIYDADEADGDLFFVMELLKGESLQSRLKREHRLTIRDSLRIGAEVASGLYAAHRLGLIHGDVSPANIWLEPTGRAKILNLGVMDLSDDTPLLSRLDTEQGTPGFMAPEQAAGEAVTDAADLFSLGCVLYQMVTGEKAFRGENAHAILRATIGDHPRPTRAINPEVPEAFDQLIMEMLAKSDRDRPKAADVENRLAELFDPGAPKKDRNTLIEDMVFKAIFGASEVPAPAPTKPDLPQPSAKIQETKPRFHIAPWLEHTIAAVVLLIALIVLIFWWRHSRPIEPQNNPAAEASAETDAKP